MPLRPGAALGGKHDLWVRGHIRYRRPGEEARGKEGETNTGVIDENIETLVSFSERMNRGLDSG